LALLATAAAKVKRSKSRCEAKEKICKSQIITATCFSRTPTTDDMRKKRMKKKSGDGM